MQALRAAGAEQAPSSRELVQFPTQLYACKLDCEQVVRHGAVLFPLECRQKYGRWATRRVSAPAYMLISLIKLALVSLPETAEPAMHQVMAGAAAPCLVYCHSNKALPSRTCPAEPGAPRQEQRSPSLALLREVVASLLAAMAGVAISGATGWLPHIEDKGTAVGRAEGPAVGAAAPTAEGGGVATSVAVSHNSPASRPSARLSCAANPAVDTARPQQRLQEQPALDIVRAVSAAPLAVLLALPVVLGALAKAGRRPE